MIRVKVEMSGNQIVTVHVTKVVCRPTLRLLVESDRLRRCVADTFFISGEFTFARIDRDRYKSGLAVSLMRLCALIVLKIRMKLAGCIPPLVKSRTATERSLSLELSKSRSSSILNAFNVRSHLP